MRRTREHSQGPVGLAQQQTSFPPFQHTGFLTNVDHCTSSTASSGLATAALHQHYHSLNRQSPSSSLYVASVPRTSSHSPRRRREAAPPPSAVASCGTSPAGSPASFRSARNPRAAGSPTRGRSSPAFSPRSAPEIVGRGITMGPPASSRLSRVRCAERVQCAEPYTPLVSAKSATESLFSPRSSSAESDDLYPDSPIAGSPHDDLSQQTGPPRMARHSGESSHPRESPRQTGARERRGPAGYNLRGDQRQQPYEYTHCHTWQAGGRETGAAETGRGPLASSGSCRTNGRNLGVSGEKLTGVGRSLAGSGRRASGRLCRKMEDDDVEDQRPGKGGGSGRLHRSMEDDDVADDGTLPRQRAPGGVSLSTAYGNPSHRLARRLEDDERQQECSRRGQPIPQAQKTAANQLHRSLEDDEYYQHGSTRVPASASLHSDVRDCRDSLRAGRAGSAGRVATGSLSRAAQAAGAGADGAAIRQSSRLCRSLERDEMAAQEASWQEKVGTWQVDGLDSAGQHGLVGGRKMPSHSARFGEVHAEGVTSEGCVAGRGSVRGGQREGEQGPGVQGKRQPMRPCRSLEEDDREDGIMVGGKSKSSGRLERRLEDDEDDDDEGTNGASGELQQLHRRLERHLSDDDDDEEDRAVYIKSRESNGQVTSKEVRGHGQAGAEKDTHKSKGLIKRLFIFQRD